MKVIAINGSPRKHWNTDQLCTKLLEGAESVGAKTELIELGDYTFKGCVSCFHCHLKKSMNDTLCFYKDELTSVLQKCQEADVIIIGSPIYYGFVTGIVRSFMERLLFPIDTYCVDDNGKRVVKINKIIPSAMLYTMNANPQQIGKDGIKINEDVMRGIFGYCESLYSYDTYQFKNYEPYAVNIFNPKHKTKVREKQFPKELKAAYDLGIKLVEKVSELNV